MATETARVDRIEALLRERRFHEADCPIRQDQRHNARGGSYAIGGQCNCWLSKENS